MERYHSGISKYLNYGIGRNASGNMNTSFLERNYSGVIVYPVSSSFCSPEHYFLGNTVPLNNISLDKQGIFILHLLGTRGLSRCVAGTFRCQPDIG